MGVLAGAGEIKTNGGERDSTAEMAECVVYDATGNCPDMVRTRTDRMGRDRIRGRHNLRSTQHQLD